MRRTRQPEPSPDATVLPVDVAQRELRQAYDAIDAGEDERALKFLDRTLKKYPRFQLARALRAIALWRSRGIEARDEAIQLGRDVRDEGVADEDTLRVLTTVFDELGSLEDTHELLESVLRSNPTHMKSLRALYVYYGRQWMFAKQQSVAMRTYKVTSDSSDLLRAVVAMLAQRDEAEAARRGDDAATQGMGADGMLKLAHGMLSKLHAKGEIKDSDSFLMYATTLAALGQNDEAYAFVVSDLAEKCVPMPIDRERSRAMYATRAGKYKEAMEHHMKVWELAPDDWLSMNAILDLCRDTSTLQEMMKDFGSLKVVSYGTGLTGFSIRTELSEAKGNFPVGRTKGLPIDVAAAKAFVERAIAAADAGGGAHVVGRGAYILKVELLCRILDSEWNELSEEALAVGIADYHERFGGSNSCAQDMRRYSHALRHSKAAREKLISTLTERSKAEVPDVIEGDDSLKKRAMEVLRSKTSALLICADLNAYCLSWHGASTESTAVAAAIDGRALARKFMEEYGRYRHLVEDADPREQTPVDIYPYLAAFALINEASSAKGVDDESAVKALLAAASVIEIGLKKSPHHAGLIFNLTAIYTLLGAASKALDAFKTLDIKHVQMSTLLHHILPACVAGGGERAKRDIFDRLDYLRWEVDEHIAEMAVTAGLNCKYTKILEFADFHRTLKRAHALHSGDLANVWREFTAKAASVVGDDPTTLQERAKEIGQELSGEFIEPTRNLSSLSTETSHWDEDDEIRDEWTYVDDFKTNPAWLAPYAEDAAFAGAIWWANPIEARAPADKPYAWFSRGARNALRRQLLLMNALEARFAIDDERDVEAKKKSLELFQVLLTQLLKASRNDSFGRTVAQATLTRDFEFSLIGLAVRGDAASLATAEDAYAKLCEWPIATLSKGDCTALLSRGAVAATVHARRHAHALRLASMAAGGSRELCSTGLALERACDAIVSGKITGFDRLAKETADWYGDSDDAFAASVAVVVDAVRESVVDALRANA